MSCPTCSGTMKTLYADSESDAIWWCQRCGTIKERWKSGDEESEAPALVLKCRAFEDGLGTDQASGMAAWNRLGIAESIRSNNRPGHQGE